MSKLKTRHQAREKLVQVLYAAVTTAEPSANVMKNFLEDNDFVQDNNVDYLQDLFFHINTNKETLDKYLTDLINKMPSIKYKDAAEISIVEHVILYIAIDEIIYQNLPSGIAINEAIELAKKFGNTNSYKFINAVLDNFVKEYGKQN